MFKALQCTAAIVLLTGCTVTPKVEYEKITNNARLSGDEIDSYAFQQTKIVIAATGNKIKDATGAEIPEVTVAVQRVEHPDFRMVLRRSDTWGVKTHLKITKVQNTALVSEVGTEVADKRVETITKVGSTIVSLLGMFSQADTGADLDLKRLPIVIDLSRHLDAEGKVVNKPNVDGNTGVTLRIEAVPPDARLSTALDRRQVLSSFVFAACRRATVAYRVNGQNFSTDVAISDPHWFQSVAFPVKGKITMHSQCGVSVESEKDNGVASEAAIFEAIAQQAKAIQEALEQRRKQDK